MTSSDTVGAAWSSGEMPPWMDRWQDPAFDECAAADAEQDAAAASPYAAAVAERFGLLSEWRREAILSPPPPPPASYPHPDDDDDIIRGRRCRKLELALQPLPGAVPGASRNRPPRRRPHAA